MKESLYGPCGLYCGACGATDCGGCLSNRIDDWVKKCTFRQCSADRKVDFCCFCHRYPCRELAAFMSDQWPHHWTMAANLEYIETRGVDAWLTAQKEEWSCRGCGSGIYWYQGECTCGRKLKAWKVPE